MNTFEFICLTCCKGYKKTIVFLATNRYMNFFYFYFLLNLFFSKLIQFFKNYSNHLQI